MAAQNQTLFKVIPRILCSRICRSSFTSQKVFSNQFRSTSVSSRGFCTSEETSESSKVSSDETATSTKRELETFEEMLQNSTLVKMGRPQGKRVWGKIFYINGDDLYVDFGWKFHGVVEKPETDPESVYKESEYKEGSWVEVEINELEQTGHFLGQHRRLSLCEADIKLIHKPSRSTLSKKTLEEKKQEAKEDLMDILLS